MTGFITKKYKYAVVCEGKQHTYEVQAYNETEAKFLVGVKFAADNPDFNPDTQEFRIRKV